MSGVLGSWRVTYTPGRWLVLCGPTSAVVLEPADASWSDLVEALWGEVLASASIGELAARLAAYRIDTMPSFAALFWGPDGMRTLVRGGVRLVDAATSRVVADGEGVQTWTEVGLSGLERVRVDLPTGTDPDAFPLPLVIGAVGASSVLLDASAHARATSPQAAGDPAEDVDAQDDPAGDDGPAEPGTATELFDPFADETPAHEDAATELMSAPPALPPDAAGTQVLDLDEPTGPGPDVTAAPAPGTLRAVFCAWGHPNPPGAERCRVCHGLIAVQAPVDVVAPVLAVLRVSNGASVPVERPVLVGRAPSPARSRADDPELLTVTSPSHDISRTHLEVVPDGWELSVTDLHSTNGTVLVAPDGSSRQLEPGESVVVALGTAIELADGVSVLVDYPQ